jgi:hypothetical protein
MARLSKIKSFYFNRAEYNITDTYGNEIILRIDYNGKNVEIEKICTQNDEIESLIAEAKLVAFDLIGRKSDNNRAGSLNVRNKK